MLLGERVLGLLSSTNSSTKSEGNLSNGSIERPLEEATPEGATGVTPLRIVGTWTSWCLGDEHVVPMVVNEGNRIHFLCDDCHGGGQETNLWFRLLVCYYTA